MASSGKPHLKALAEQVIVVTGASSGIGRLTAVRAVEQGASVVLVARSQVALGKLEAELNQLGKGSALAVPCDVADEQQVRRVAEQTLARFGRIDTWINNASVGMWGRLDQIVARDAVQLFAINFFGVVHGSQAALPALRANPHGGSLINIGSEVSDDFVPLQAMYTSSKHAVKGYTDGLRVEIQEIDKLPINIALIQPQAVDTPFSQHARNYTSKEAKLPKPLIDPQTVVDAILKACVQPTRDQPVGGVSYGSTALAKLWPKASDKAAASLIDKQQHDAPVQTWEGTLFQSCEQMDASTTRAHPAPNPAVPDIKPKHAGRLADPTTPIRFSDSLEKPADGEAAAIEELRKQFLTLGDKTHRQCPAHAVRTSHAKASGCLVGTLRVSDDLPDELRQGLFQRPGATYEVAARVAQGPGEVLSDSISTHRGLSLKVFGVEGEKVAGDSESSTQDLLFSTGKAFTDASPQHFLTAMKGLVTAASLPHAIHQVVSSAARATNSVLAAVSAPLRQSHGASAASTDATADDDAAPSGRLDFFGHPPVHPLGENYYSQVPMRYGAYVAKLALFAATPEQEALRSRQYTAAELAQSPNLFRDVTLDFCRHHTVRFDVRVQLCVDLAAQPIETGNAVWPEELSPFRSVGVVEFAPQEAFSAARAAFFDDQLSFAPTHSLVEHRGLGGIFRARLQIYQQLAQQRAAHNGKTIVEAKGTKDIPA